MKENNLYIKELSFDKISKEKYYLIEYKDLKVVVISKACRDKFYDVLYRGLEKYKDSVGFLINMIFWFRNNGVDIKVKLIEDEFNIS